MGEVIAPPRILSLSGGRTSSFLYENYSCDEAVFALVHNEDPKCAHPDKGIWRQVQDRAGFDVIGTPEHYLTPKVILDLEQRSGKQITWLAGDSFEQVIKNHGNALPNTGMRFCTTDMKLKPIFEHCYFKYGFVTMAVGYRHDEQERKESLVNTFEFPYCSNLYGQYRQKLREVEWRECETPLIDDVITSWHVNQYWAGQGVDFPPDSNCQMCFWKDTAQLRKNFDDSPHVMQWAKRMEKQTKRRFRRDISMSSTERQGLQLDFFYGTGAGCKAGECMN